MVSVALLSNPSSTGNRALLPRIRDFCAGYPDIFHYEVEDASQIGPAFQSIAMVRPRVIAINGGDGTVQAALTELYSGDHFDGAPPPIAVLPNGKTNLIAMDLGADSDPLKALERVLEIANTDLDSHVISRQLISLSGGQDGTHGDRPVLGMFLGGAGLVEIMLYCRHKIYPLGLPNGLSHFIAAIAAIIGVLFRIGGRFLPRRADPVQVSLIRDGQHDGRFALLIVTTLEKMLLHADMGATAKTGSGGSMKFFAIDQDRGAVARGIWAAIAGNLGKTPLRGVHFEQGDMVRIEGKRSSVILDGELYQGDSKHPIVLRSTAPVPFLRIAA